MELFTRRRDLALTLIKIKDLDTMDSSRESINRLYILAAAEAIKANFEVSLNTYSLRNITLTIRLFEDNITWSIITDESNETDNLNQDKIIDEFIKIHLYS